MPSSPRLPLVLAVAVFLGSSTLPVLADVDPSECTLDIHNVIEETRRLELTLGEQTDFKAAFLDFGEKFARELELGGAAKFARDAAFHAIDTGRLAGDIDEKLSDEDYVAAMADISEFLADRVSGGLDESWVINRLSKNMNQREKEELIAALGRTLDEDSPFLTALEKGKDVDIGNLLGNVSSEQYHEAAKALTMFIAEKAFPPAKVMQEALHAVHVAGAAGRDWIANEQVAAMYAAYKANRNDYRNPRAAFDLDERTRYTAVAEEKTRQMMRALGQGVDPVTGHIPDSKVQDFLFEQFELWIAREARQAQDGDRLALAKQSYFDLPPLCRSRLTSLRWPEGRSGYEKVKMRLTDRCYYEREGFKAWSELYLYTHDELSRWNRRPSYCGTPGQFQLQVQHIVCRDLEEPDGMTAWREAFNQTVKKCGWAPEYKARVLDAEGGAPVADAYVGLESEKLAVGLGPSATRSVFTDARGIARLEDLPMGYYQVEVGARDYEPARLGRVELHSPAAVVRTVYLTRTEPLVRTASLRPTPAVPPPAPKIDPGQCGFQALAQWDGRSAGSVDEGEAKAWKAARGSARPIEVPGPGRLRVQVRVTGKHEQANNTYGAERYRSGVIFRSDPEVMGTQSMRGGDFYPGVSDVGQNTKYFPVKGPGDVSVQFVPESCSLRMTEEGPRCWTLGSTQIPGIKLLDTSYEIQVKFDPCEN